MIGLITENTLWNIITQPYTQIIGDMFYVTLYLFFIAVLYIKSQDIGTVAIFAIVSGAVMMSLIPSVARFFIAGIVILAVAAILWRVLKK